MQDPRSDDESDHSQPNSEDSDGHAALAKSCETRSTQGDQSDGSMPSPIKAEPKPKGKQLKTGVIKIGLHGHMDLDKKDATVYVVQNSVNLRTYNGITNNELHRLRQHNGVTKGGAWNTKLFKDGGAWLYGYRI